jgi:hypothetical protein
MSTSARLVLGRLVAKEEDEEDRGREADRGQCVCAARRAVKDESGLTAHRPADYNHGW